MLICMTSHPYGPQFKIAQGPENQISLRLGYITTMKFSCIFGHFQVFTTVKICFTLSRRKMTFNMGRFKLSLVCVG